MDGEKSRFPYSHSNFKKKWKLISNYTYDKDNKVIGDKYIRWFIMVFECFLKKFLQIRMHDKNCKVMGSPSQKKSQLFFPMDVEL